MGEHNIATENSFPLIKSEKAKLEKKTETSKTEKTKKRYLRDIIEMIIAIFAAWLFYQGLAFALQTPMPIVAVVSGSMEPILHRGDLLIVAKADYAIGDIVIYNRDDVKYTIVHRIIDEKEEGFILKGDNNPHPDRGYVKKEQILGKVRVAIPLLGYPRLALYALGI